MKHWRVSALATVTAAVAASLGIYAGQEIEQNQEQQDQIEQTPPRTAGPSVDPDLPRSPRGGARRPLSRQRPALPKHRTGPRTEARSERSGREQVRRVSRRDARRGAALGRRRPQALRLSVCGERIQRGAYTGAGGTAGADAWRGVGRAGRRGAARHRHLAGVSRTRRARGPVGTRGWCRRGRRRRDHRHGRRRRLAGASELLRPHRRQQERRRRETELSADPRLARQVRPRRRVQRLELQSEADWRAVFRGGTAGQPRDARLRVPVAARLRRPRHPHLVHCRRQRRRPAAGLVRQAERHRAAGAYRDIQGLFRQRRGPRHVFHFRQRGGDRPGGHRRRRRDQLLHRRHDDFFTNVVEVAFFNAAEAGVFVAAAAGNSGPTASTVAHPSPWITTVAATTHPRSGTTTITLGNGATYSGASTAAATPALPMVLSAAVGLPNGDNPATPDNEVALCFSGTLDPAKVAGKMVVCDRGINARVDKSLAVAMAGGQAMVLANIVAGTLDPDFHSVPTIHVNPADGAAIKAYAAGANPTGKLAAAVITPTGNPPAVAGFSSRGPVLAAGGDLLKPDVSAPGRRRHRRRSPRPATAARCSRAIRARRWRLRTWRDSPPCSSSCIRTGRR